MHRTLTDVENEVRGWSVQDVITWLKYTSSGMFEEYVPAFNENHITGEALLTLTNEVLRDELGITSYGKRYELEKAIKKLAQQGSKKNSPLKKSSGGQRISQTYYKGMNDRHAASPAMVSSITDNWENLDVIATDTKILNEQEYQQAIQSVVSEVTGTEINKKTREKHSFFRKLSNLNLDSQRKVLSMDDGTAIVTKNGSLNESGGYEYDVEIPNWERVPTTQVLQHIWDEWLGKWTSKVIYVKIAPKPFGRGSLRMSYYCLNLGEDLNLNNLNHIGSPSSCKAVNSKNDTEQNNRILFNKLIGNKKVFGGRLCVAKKNFGICDSVEAYFYDCRTQCESMRFAVQYNRHNPPKKVAFLQSSVIEVMDDQDKTEDVEFYCIESYLHGSYVKHLDNHGGDEKIRNTPSAFAHFSYEASNKKMLICDIQGVGDLYTDPQIHTLHGKGFGMGNLGNDGIIKFFKTHECNSICRHLRLNSTNTMGINQDLIYGTRPDQQFMPKKKIDTVDTSYLDDTHFLMKLPPLFHRKISMDYLPTPPQCFSMSLNNQTNLHIAHYHKYVNGKELGMEEPLLADDHGNGYSISRSGKTGNEGEGTSCCHGCIIC